MPQCIRMTYSSRIISNALITGAPKVARSLWVDDDILRVMVGPTSDDAIRPPALYLTGSAWRRYHHRCNTRGGVRTPSQQRVDACRDPEQHHPPRVRRSRRGHENPGTMDAIVIVCMSMRAKTIKSPPSAMDSLSSRMTPWMSSMCSKQCDVKTTSAFRGKSLRS